MTDPRIEAAARCLFGDKVDQSSGSREYLLGEVEKALAAADAAAWRPIATAPKDRTRIMIRKTTGHICVAFFHDGEWYGDDWYCVHHDEYITHWQPLPAPPNDDVKP